MVKPDKLAKMSDYVGNLDEKLLNYLLNLDGIEETQGGWKVEMVEGKKGSFKLRRGATKFKSRRLIVL